MLAGLEEITSGSIFIGERRVNDLALWLAPAADPVAVQRSLRDAAQRVAADGAALDASLESALIRYSAIVPEGEIYNDAKAAFERVLEELT